MNPTSGSTRVRTLTGTDDRHDRVLYDAARSKEFGAAAAAGRQACGGRRPEPRIRIRDPEAGRRHANRAGGIHGEPLRGDSGAATHGLRAERRPVRELACGQQHHDLPRRRQGRRGTRRAAPTRAWTRRRPPTTRRTAAWAAARPAARVVVRLRLRHRQPRPFLPHRTRPIRPSTAQCLARRRRLVPHRRRSTLRARGRLRRRSGSRSTAAISTSATPTRSSASSTPDGDLKAQGEPEKLLDLPTGGHSTRNIIFNRAGTKMYVAVGSRVEQRRRRRLPPRGDSRIQSRRHRLSRLRIGHPQSRRPDAAAGHRHDLGRR